MAHEHMNNEELEYAVFCIEGVAERLGIGGAEAYDLLVRQSDILYEYVVANFDILHTQSKEYVVDDMVARLQEQGVL